MPRLSLYTNVPAGNVDASALLKDLTAAAARSIGKDEERFMTLFHPDQKMFYAGSEEPAAFLEVASIGFIGGDKNVTISAALTETIGKHLSVPADRVYINFFDIASPDWGARGSTHAALNKGNPNPK